MPYLQEVHGHSRALAAQHASLLLFGVAVGALVVGLVSDRLGSRRGVMRVYALLYALSWLPWIARVEWPLPATLAWFFLMGLLIPGFTLSWTIAKEVNRPEHSGIATVGRQRRHLPRHRASCNRWSGSCSTAAAPPATLAAAWDRGILILAGAAACGALCTLFVRESAR